MVCTQGPLIRPNFSIPSGNKAELAKRLAKAKLNPPSIPTLLREIEDYLQETGSVPEGERPVLAQAYASGFNHVDKFNRLLSAVSYKPRQVSTDWCMLCAIIEMALVHTWALEMDWKLGLNEDEEEAYVRKWAQDLATLLLH